MQSIFKRQSGEQSRYPSGKNPLGSFRNLIGVQSLDQELESIGGLSLVSEFEGLNAGGTNFVFQSHELNLNVRKDTDGVYKTFLSEKQSDGSYADIENGVWELTREPSVAVSSAAAFFTFGGKVHKIQIDNGDVVVKDDLLGANSVAAIDFGGNRLFGIAGKLKIISNMSPGGDEINTFVPGDAWTEPGIFGTETIRSFTNVRFVDSKVVFFSPNRIEINTIEEAQKDDGSGNIISYKKTSNYASLEGIGTSSFRSLGVYLNFVGIIDEASKSFLLISSQKDQNGQVIFQEVETSKRNLKELEFDRYFTFYSNELKSFIISCRGEESVSNDRVFFYNPSQDSFSQKKWSVMSLTEDDLGNLILNSSNEPKIMQYEKEIFTEDGNVPMIEFQTNDITHQEFWRKLKIRTLAFNFLMSPDAEISLFQSVDGGDWINQDIILRPQTLGGSFESPYPILGKTTEGLPRRENADDVVQYIAGKVRVRAKGTKVAYKVQVKTDKKFKLKSWAITKLKISGRRKYANLRKT